MFLLVKRISSATWAPLGNSDHVVLSWKVTVVRPDQTEQNDTKFNFWKADYNAISSELKFNDNYRVRSWRSDAINYYITYCQIADLKLLTEN